MKKATRNVLLGLCSILTLASCHGTSDNTSSSLINGGEPLLSSLLVQVQDNNHYSLSFHLDNVSNQGISFYASKDTHLDNGDTKLDAKYDNSDFILSYQGMDNDFYLLVCNSYQEVVIKENIVLPTFILSITSSNGATAGYDDLTFSYLENGYTSANFFDVDGITIYRSDDPSFLKGKTKAVLENVTISDSFSIPNPDNEQYYLFTSSFGNGKGTYISQPLKKDTTYGESLVTISSVTLNQEEENTRIEIKGEKKNTDALSLRLVLANETAPLVYSDCTFSGSQFTGSIDLSKPSSTGTSYSVYLSFLAGVYMPLDYSLLTEKDKEKKVVDGNVFSLFDSNGKLVLIRKNKSAINITSAKLTQEENKVYFETTGILDRTLLKNTPLTGPTLVYTAPSLAMVSDDNEEKILYPLNVTGNSFSLKADLTMLTKLGPWYTMYLYFPDSDNGLVGSDATTYSTQAVYSYQISDVNDMNVVKDISSTYTRYRFQSYNNNLKLELKNYSADITSFHYKKINGNVTLELKGTLLVDSPSHFSVFYGENKDVHDEDVVPDKEGNFTCDININDIEPYVNYHIHWIGEAIGDIQLTNEYIEKPHEIISSDDGYIYCVKIESYQSYRYFKVFKDYDAAKVSDINFILDNNLPKASFKGYLNSSNRSLQDQLYLQLCPVSITGSSLTFEEGSTYAPVSVNEDLTFSSVLDLSSMVKNKPYQVKLMKKINDSYLDLSTDRVSYCGFYTEYLPLDYGTKSLVTSSGIFHIRNFGGTNSHYEIYFSLE